MRALRLFFTRLIGLADGSVCPTPQGLMIWWGRRFRLPTDFLKAFEQGGMFVIRA
jgi:hypothetical protein